MPRRNDRVVKAGLVCGYATMQRPATGSKVLSGTIEKLDFTRRQISLRVGHEVRTLRSRKPLNLPGIRLGDTIDVALDEDGAMFVGKPHAQRTHPVRDRRQDRPIST